MYLGYAVFLLIDLDNDYRRHLVVIVGAAALAGITMTGAAFWLERICRIDAPDDESGPEASAA